MMEKKLKNFTKSQVKALDRFVENNKNIIIERYKINKNPREMLASDDKILSMYKNDVRNKVKNEGLNLKQAEKRVLRSRAYTSAKEVDIDTLIKEMKQQKTWEEFRKLNRKQKYTINEFTRVKVDDNAPGVKRRYIYIGEASGYAIQIDFKYDSDGNYYFDQERIDMEVAKSMVGE